jgi:hypothetical protein
MSARGLSLIISSYHSKQPATSSGRLRAPRCDSNARSSAIRSIIQDQQRGKERAYPNGTIAASLPNAPHAAYLTENHDRRRLSVGICRAKRLSRYVQCQATIRSVITFSNRSVSSFDRVDTKIGILVLKYWCIPMLLRLAAYDMTYYYCRQE